MVMERKEEEEGGRAWCRNGTEKHFGLCFKRISKAKVLGEELCPMEEALSTWRLQEPKAGRLSFDVRGACFRVPLQKLVCLRKSPLVLRTTESLRNNQD